MKAITIHSKLIDLQGQVIPSEESESLISQVKGILLLAGAGQISRSDAGARIRQLAWRISEDLKINDLDMSSGTDDMLLEKLPALLKA